MLFRSVEFSGNRIAKTYWPKGGYWGPMTDCAGVPGVSTTLWDETGSAVPLG